MTSPIVQTAPGSGVARGPVDLGAETGAMQIAPNIYVQSIYAAHINVSTAYDDEEMTEDHQYSLKFATWENPSPLLTMVHSLVNDKDMWR